MFFRELVTHCFKISRRFIYYVNDRLSTISKTEIGEDDHLHKNAPHFHTLHLYTVHTV